MDKVLMSFGVSNKVAVSSFIRFRNTNANAAAIPRQHGGNGECAENIKNDYAQGFVPLFSTLSEICSKRATQRGLRHRQIQHEIGNNYHKERLVERIRIVNGEIHQRQRDNQARHGVQ